MIRMKGLETSEFSASLSGKIGPRGVHGVKIYVDLPDEAVAVWCPVEAVHIDGDIYQIVEINSDPEDTRWAFDTGTQVRCKRDSYKRGEADHSCSV
jgi:hypothetical protein